MTNSAEAILRWEPLPNLPEHPVGSIDIAYRDGSLIAIASYAIEPPLKGVRLDFGRVEAFKVYEEFSDPWVGSSLPQPMINNDRLNRWAWPLQQVSNSSWVARVLSRNSPLDYREWRHLVVVTMDVTLHVMVDFEPEVEVIS